MGFSTNLGSASCPRDPMRHGFNAALYAAVAACILASAAHRSGATGLDSNGRPRRTHAAAVLAISALSLVAVEAAAQMPGQYTNLQVLPKDISRTKLIEIMCSFSFALGVRCQYCHVGGDGRSFEGVEFDKDDDRHKRQARFMMQMAE